MTLFYLGTHHPHWLRLVDVPLVVSRNRLVAYKTLPRARAPWVLDSSGFSELARNGRWRFGPRQYAGDVRRFRDEVGELAWAACQDWMVEPHVRAKTGFSTGEHQRLTIENYLELRSLAPDLPFAPVLQGWEGHEYLDHADQYARAGIALERLPVVGIGSVCRRQTVTGVRDAVQQLALSGVRLHGFGLKLTGLRLFAGLFASADSMAWSFHARKQRRPLCGGTDHKHCANCRAFALMWREKVLASYLDGDGAPRPVQLRLPERVA